MDNLWEEVTSGIGYTFCKSAELRNQRVLIQRSCLADVPVFVVYSYGINCYISCTTFSTTDEDVCQLFWYSSVSCFIMHAHWSHCNTVF